MRVGPSVPPAPGVLRTTTGTPKVFSICAAMARATRSVPPPGPKPVTSCSSRLGQRGSGCAFSPRCPNVLPRCPTDLPPLDPIGLERRAACWNPMP